MSEKELYEDKIREYFDGERPEMLKYIPTNATKILEVGCGSGSFGALIKKNHNVEIWGIELDEKAAAIAATKLDKIISEPFSEHLDLPKKEFDCLVFNDVLEHLVDPYSVLLYSKELLKPEGVVVASIPNVRYITNLYKLVIEADWQYTNDGILDKTHLRFFTRKSIITTFKELDFTIRNIEGIHRFEDNLYPLNVQPKRKLLFTKTIEILDKLLPIAVEDVFYKQFAIVAGYH